MASNPQPRMTAQDKKWQAQDDARTLAQANEVKSDTPRLKAAVKEAKIMVKDEQKRLTSISKVAKVKVLQGKK